MSPATRAALKRVAGWCVTIAALGFFIERIAANGAHMPPVAWGLASASIAVISVFLALSAIGLSALAWWVLLVDQRAGVPAGRVVPLFLVSQFGKYLPGNVGQFVGRVVLARDAAIPPAVTLATMMTEVLWNVGTALGVSALAMYLFLGTRLASLPPWMDVTGLCACFVALLAAPWVGTTLLRRVFPGIVAKVFSGSELRSPGWFAALKVSMLYVACYACLGAALDLQARFLFGAPSAPLVQVSGFFALAWLAGYLLPGAPAGIGVRESVMLVLLAPLYGESTAIALGITLRLASTLADALALLAGWYWRSKQRRSAQRPIGISSAHGEE
jgi:hypothetical protein